MKMSLQVNRRTALIASFASIGSIGAAHSQEAIAIPFEDARNIHRASLARLESLPRDTLFLSRQAIESTFAELLQAGIIDENGKAILDTLVDLIFFEAKEVGSAVDFIVNYLSSVDFQDNHVVSSISAVIFDSIEYASERLQGVEYDTVIRVVAHDIQGAGQGAVTGATLGSIIPSLGTVAGAVLGALAGGASSSAIGFFDAARRNI